VSQDELSTLLQDVELCISAHVTEAVTNRAVDSFPMQEKHELNSKSQLARDKCEFVSAGNFTFVVWKVSLHLTRPRVRVQRPIVTFSANLSLQLASKGSSRDPPELTLLKSYEPLPANVLAPFQSDPKLSKVDIFLSESRITKVAPSSGAAATARAIRGSSKVGVPVVPALFIRIKHVAVADAILASVHLDTSRFITGLLTLESITCDASGQAAHPLIKMKSVERTSAGDETILIYRIPNSDRPPNEIMRPLMTITIEATAIVEQHLETQLLITWQSYLECPAPSSAPRYSWSRPTSTLSVAALRNSASATPRPPSSDSYRERTMFHISGPSTASVKEDLCLHIQCSNRSSRSRRFALAMQLSRKVGHSRIRAAASASHAVARLFEPTTLHPLAQQTMLVVNPDLRIGPLPSGATFETDLIIRALDPGILELGPLHIVDLDLRQTVDIHELPDIMVAEGGVRS
jgi:hypothetical protein